MTEGSIHLHQYSQRYRTLKYFKAHSNIEKSKQG